MSISNTDYDVASLEKFVKMYEHDDESPPTAPSIITKMNFQDLQKCFAKICEDYMQPLIHLNKASKAVEFCNKIIYEIGPEAHRANKTQNFEPTTWRCFFDDNSSVTKFAIVASNFEPDFTYFFDAINNTIELSVSAASLLAIPVLNQLNNIAINNNNGTSPSYILTPLAGSIFSVNDVISIAASINCSQEKVLAEINASCQSDGHHLAESKLHIAAVAVIFSSRKSMKNNPRKRDELIGKTFKKYLDMNKKWDPQLFQIYLKYRRADDDAVPSPAVLIQRFEDIQRRKAAAEAAQEAHGSA